MTRNPVSIRGMTSSANETETDRSIQRLGAGAPGRAAAELVVAYRNKAARFLTRSHVTYRRQCWLPSGFAKLAICLEPEKPKVKSLKKLERAMRFELTTLTLARLCHTVTSVT